MKLFNKTILFFIVIIIIQAYLTGLILTQFIKNQNDHDAKEELKEEASIVYDSYNSWKRNIWINLIALKNDKKLSELLEKYNNISEKSYLPFDIERVIKDKLLPSGIDCVVVKNERNVTLKIIGINYNFLSYTNTKHIENIKPHPYIENIILRKKIRIGKKQSSFIDVFIVKGIDGQFAESLSLNRRSDASFFLDNKCIVGHFAEID